MMAFFRHPSVFTADRLAKQFLRGDRTQLGKGQGGRFGKAKGTAQKGFTKRPDWNSQKSSTDPISPAGE